MGLGWGVEPQCRAVWVDRVWEHPEVSSCWLSSSGVDGSSRLPSWREQGWLPISACCEVPVFRTPCSCSWGPCPQRSRSARSRSLFSLVQGSDPSKLPQAGGSGGRTGHRQLPGGCDRFSRSPVLSRLPGLPSSPPPEGPGFSVPSPVGLTGSQTFRLQIWDLAFSG